MNPIRAVLFDLDNTLFYWDPCDQRGREAAHEPLRQEFDVSFEHFMLLHDEARDYLKRHLPGQSANHNRLLFFSYIADRLSPRPRPELALKMHERYWHAFFTAMRPHPDALRVLGHLKQKYKLAVLSNHVAEPQFEKIVRLGFEPYFDAIVTSEEAGAEKPDPRIYQLTLAKLGVTASEALMIGDHPRGDMQGAHDAGLRTIYMAEFTGSEPAPACADNVVHRLADILEIISPPKP